MELKPIKFHNWKEDDFKRLDAVKGTKEYLDLVNVARPILARISEKGMKIVGQLCGPMNTGGKGPLEENMKVFNIVIDHLAKKDDIVIFDQRPFEEEMQQIKIRRNTKGYPFDLLYEFYGTIFTERHVQVLYFIPEWYGSIGTSWERYVAEQIFRIPCVDIPPEFVEKLLEQAA